MDIRRVEAALLDPKLEASWEECLANWEDGTPEQIEAARTWIQQYRDQFLTLARDIVDDSEMLATMIAIRYIEHKAQWTFFNNVINYGLMARGECNFEIIYRSTLISSLIEALEPLLKYQDFENITSFLAEPIQTSQSTRVTLHVDEGKLSQLFSCMEELVMGRILLEGSYHQMEQALQRSAPPDAWRRGVEEAYEALRQGHEEYSRSSEAVQEGVMALRFMPFSALLQRFTAYIERTSERLGQQIDVEVFGGEVEIEKQIAESLIDPLFSLLGYAMEASIEPGEVRRAHGKKENGSLSLSATYQGDRILIEVRDDGRGLDPEVIGSIAVMCGLLSQEEADRMDAQERLQLMFREGFAMGVEDEETEYVKSMSTVRERIEQFKGTIEVASTPGKGTRFFIGVPLSLAVINILLVRLGERRVALPLYAVRETLRVSWDDVHSVKGRPTIHLRGATLPVIPLARLLGYPTDPTLQETSSLPMVVIESAGESSAVVVSDVLQKLEAVLKPLGPLLSEARYVSGGTILSDGRVVPVLDPAQLVHLS